MRTQWWWCFLNDPAPSLTFCDRSACLQSQGFSSPGALDVILNALSLFEARLNRLAAPAQHQRSTHVLRSHPTQMGFSVQFPNVPHSLPVNYVVDALHLLRLCCLSHLFHLCLCLSPGMVPCGAKGHVVAAKCCRVAVDCKVFADVFLCSAETVSIMPCLAPWGLPVTVDVTDTA